MGHELNADSDKRTKETAKDGGGKKNGNKFMCSDQCECTIYYYMSMSFIGSIE